MKGVLATVSLCLLLATPACTGLDRGMAASQRDVVTTVPMRGENATVDPQQRSWIEASCATERRMGPSSYYPCIQRNLRAVESPGARTDLSHPPKRDVVTTVPKRGENATTLRDLRTLAEQGDATAQNNLGVTYHNGEGVRQDYTEALKWYRRAAEQGDVYAENNLGVMYAAGQGVPENYKEAVKWYRKAAERGHDVAQNNLGLMYKAGTGVPQDHVRAYKWFIIAAALGNEDARNNRDFYTDFMPLFMPSDQMSPAEIAKAQNLASEWWAAFEKRQDK